MKSNFVFCSSNYSLGTLFTISQHYFGKVNEQFAFMILTSNYINQTT